MILTAYRQQMLLITKFVDDLMKNRGGDEINRRLEISVMTIDSSQGSECNYVILSMVKSTRHTRDVSTLVVALSRASFGVWVICSFDIFNPVNKWPTRRRSSGLKPALSSYRRMQYE